MLQPDNYKAKGREEAGEQRFFPTRLILNKCYPHEQCTIFKQIRSFMFWSYNMKISVLDNSLYMRNCLIYVARIGSPHAFKKIFVYLFI